MRDMRIMVVDDDADLRDVLTYLLRRRGYTVTTAANGEMAMAMFEKEPADLLVLDVSMPKMDGLQVCRAIREVSTVPIIMLTVMGSETDVVRSLETGADDHISKPFDHQELMARVEAVLRRAYRLKTAERSEIQRGPLVFGPITIDPGRHLMTKNGEAINLTKLEFKLLYFLMSNAGQVLNHNDIMERVWGYDSESDYDVLRVHLSRLRHKLETDPANPRLIQTIPGVGYSFRPEVYAESLA